MQNKRALPLWKRPLFVYADDELMQVPLLHQAPFFYSLFPAFIPEAR